MSNPQNTMATWRFERKFLLEGVSLAAAEARINLHPAAFRTTFPTRRVNNIYYDTLEMDHYQDNNAGTSSRQKFRVRWYGKTEGAISTPILEIKRKEGLIGSKDSFPLNSFELHSAFNLSQLTAPLTHPDLPKSPLLEWSSLNPVLVNTYVRKYYESYDGAFRLTLDHGLSFFPVFGDRARLMSPYPLTNALVVEVKYSTEEDERIHKLTSAFAFRVTKSSKYAMGIERILGK